jgi:hypothetical protein
MAERVAYSVKETAEAIDADAKTIRKGIAEGKIPSLSLGPRFIRVPAWWIRQQRDGKPPVAG